MSLTAKRAAVGVVALVVLVAAVTVGMLVGRHTASTAATSPAPTAGRSCGPAGTPGPARVVPTTWENVTGWELPWTTSDGPLRRDPDGPWDCYAHTQTGAVLAGWIIAVRGDGLAENWKAVVRAQTVPGPAQTTKLSSPPQQDAGQVNLRGFSVSGYTDDRATISYYLSSAQQEDSCTVNLVWYAQDWRVQLQQDGSSASGCTAGVPTSFVPYGPPS